jgi:hypothetical protein
MLTNNGHHYLADQNIRILPMPQKIRSQMKISIRALLSAAAVVLLSLTMVGTVRPQARPVIQDRFSSVDNVKLHYLVAGRGEPVILLHGYAQNSHICGGR